MYIPIILYDKPQINYQIRYQTLNLLWIFFLIRCMNFILVLHIELPIFFQFPRHAVNYLIANFSNYRMEIRIPFPSSL